MLARSTSAFISFMRDSNAASRSCSLPTSSNFWFRSSFNSSIIRTSSSLPRYGCSVQTRWALRRAISRSLSFRSASKAYSSSFFSWAMLTTLLLSRSSSLLAASIFSSTAFSAFSFSRVCRSMSWRSLRISSSRNLLLWDLTSASLRKERLVISMRLFSFSNFSRKSLSSECIPILIFSIFAFSSDTVMSCRCFISYRSEFAICTISRSLPFSLYKRSFPSSEFCSRSSYSFFTVSRSASWRAAIFTLSSSVSCWKWMACYFSFRLISQDYCQAASRWALAAACSSSACRRTSATSACLWRTSWKILSYSELNIYCRWCQLRSSMSVESAISWLKLPFRFSYLTYCSAIRCQYLRSISSRYAAVFSSSRWRSPSPSALRVASRSTSRVLPSRILLMELISRVQLYLTSPISCSFSPTTRRTRSSNSCCRSQIYEFFLAMRSFTSSRSDSFSCQWHFRSRSSCTSSRPCSSVFSPSCSFSFRTWNSYSSIWECSRCRKELICRKLVSSQPCFSRATSCACNSDDSSSSPRSLATSSSKASTSMRPSRPSLLSSATLARDPTSGSIGERTSYPSYFLRRVTFSLSEVRAKVRGLSREGLSQAAAASLGESAWMEQLRLLSRVPASRRRVGLFAVKSILIVNYISIMQSFHYISIQCCLFRNLSLLVICTPKDLHGRVGQ